MIFKDMDDEIQKKRDLTKYYYTLEKDVITYSGHNVLKEV